MPEWLLDAIAWAIPVILAITLHEAAHGWMAEKFGDDTARRLGRVTFNPIRHIDKFGTLIFPALLYLLQSPILFGYAKPVPVEFHRLNPPRLGMFMVAIAGVLVNFGLAVASALLLHLESSVTPEQAPWLFTTLYRSIMINCVLIVFNLIPILPLDGGRVVDSLLTGKPKRIYGKLERWGIPLVFLVLLVPPLLGMDLAQSLIGVPTFWLIGQLMWLTGNGQSS
jgi:Zn-dependent protease